MLAFLLLAGPISMLPGQWLASTLFSNSATPMELFFYPVSTVILIIGVFWGITQGVVELPYYFSHVHSQLKQRNYARWKIIFALSFGLAFQHVALPFIPDLNFMLWRFGMFLPLAVTLALGLTWRPQLLPYLMIIHGIMDIATVGSYLSFQ